MAGGGGGTGWKFPIFTPHTHTLPLFACLYMWWLPCVLNCLCPGLPSAFCPLPHPTICAAFPCPCPTPLFCLSSLPPFLPLTCPVLPRMGGWMPPIVTFMPVPNCGYSPLFPFTRRPQHLPACLPCVIIPLSVGPHARHPAFCLHFYLYQLPLFTRCSCSFPPSWCVPPSCSPWRR